MIVHKAAMKSIKLASINIQISDLGQLAKIWLNYPTTVLFAATYARAFSM